MMTDTTGLLCQFWQSLSGAYVSYAEGLAFDRF